MKLPYELVEYVYIFMDHNEIPLHHLCKYFYLRYSTKRSTAVRKIIKWYRKNPIPQMSTFNIYALPKKKLIRSILKNIQRHNEKLFLTLPEFICIKVQNPVVQNEMRTLPHFSIRKRSEVVRFLLKHNDIRSRYIINIILGICNLRNSMV